MNETCFCRDHHMPKNTSWPDCISLVLRLKHGQCTTVLPDSHPSRTGLPFHQSWRNVDLKELTLEQLSRASARNMKVNLQLTHIFCGDRPWCTILAKRFCDEFKRNVAPHSLGFVCLCSSKAAFLIGPSLGNRDHRRKN